MLDDNPIWSRYKDLKHDLFISRQQKKDYFLTEGAAATTQKLLTAGITTATTTETTDATTTTTTTTTTPATQDTSVLGERDTLAPRSDAKDEGSDAPPLR